jgi:hypothetical protein
VYISQGVGCGRGQGGDLVVVAIELLQLGIAAQIQGSKLIRRAVQADKLRTGAGIQAGHPIPVAEHVC